MSNLNTVIDDEIRQRHAEISSLNKHIFDNPELAYEEHKAHDAFVAALRELGFEVTPHAYGLETAFSADVGSGGRLVVFNAEYDALPGIGHACGHNLISSASFAAFLGAAAALKTSGKPGRLRLLGTPAEEGGGGKLKLIENGAYTGASAALMVHPGSARLLPPGLRGIASIRMLANVKMRTYFKGREAHAAVAPWDGVNALDAVCLSYNAISMLRQQIRPHERIHGVIRAGGTRPNVTPADCALEYYVRSGTRATAQALWDRVQKCFEGAAIATGCSVSYEPLNSYADVRPSRAICEEYVRAMDEVSGPKTVALDGPGATEVLPGSTDMGNVCYECPGFHGVFGIEAPAGASNHTKGFTAAAGTEDALARAIECGRGMARVAWKLLEDDAFAERVQKEWEADMKLAAEEH
jgi:amidohydrolase